MYGIRLPPAATRLTAPNFSLIPRSATTTSATSSGAEPNPNGPIDGVDGDGEGEDEDSEEDEDEDDDEEMEDVTAGIGGAGELSGSRPAANGTLGLDPLPTSAGSQGKRKVEELEEYD